MKNITSSAYTFANLIENDFLYIDKTEYIWQLIQSGLGHYFLSRPRRFGKSLAISTLEAIFQGRKELFQGLAIYDKPYDWESYPVIHLDWGDRTNTSLDKLEVSARELLQRVADSYNIQLDGDDAQTQFSNLIVSLAKQSDKGKVVILIDEYVKPILDNIATPQAEEFLQFLRGFYSVIKTTEPYQRFVFLTGVSKFSHVSIFSGLNNLTDITMNAKFATMLGYTQDELERYFSDRIDKVAQEQNMSRTEMLAKIKTWYNGYRFDELAPTVYNPVSLAHFFNNGGKFSNYWFQTGTPSFLLELIKAKKFNCAADIDKPVPESFFNAFEITKLAPLTLLYQTGYLTIDRAADVPVPFTNKSMRLYYLHFPNWEVESSFNDSLLEYYTALQKQETPQLQMALITAAAEGDVDKFMNLMKTIFANVPYDIHCKEEFYYQSLFYLICYMLNTYVQAEMRTNDGRIDMTIQVGDWIYIIEFKLDKTAGEALEQIKEKNYAQKFMNENKRIMLVGANFDSKTGQIGNWDKHELNP